MSTDKNNIEKVFGNPNLQVRIFRLPTSGCGIHWKDLPEFILIILIIEVIRLWNQWRHAPIEVKK